MEIILASASPRRQALMQQAGLAFSVLVTHADESLSADVSPAEAVAEIARRKAHAAVTMPAAPLQPDTVIVAADTVVALDGHIFGKPDDEGDAFAMLSALAGRVHSVFTGICVARIGHNGVTYLQDVCETRVTMRPLEDADILDYIASGEPMDKAGAYAIQGEGARLVQAIDGDYENVVGLSTARLLALLQK